MKLIADIIAGIEGDAPVKEVRIGPFWTGVESRYCGLATTTYTHDPLGPYPVSESGFLTEKSGLELCQYAFSDSLLEASVGLATINSMLDVDMDHCKDINAGQVLEEEGAGKKVVVVGHFPFVEKLKAIAGRLWVLERRPQSGDLPADQAERVIPQADVVAITGTALINGTMEGLLKLCRPDSLVMVLGPTTPLTPLWFDYGVDIVSGTRVVDPAKVLRFVSQGIVFKQLRGRGVRLLSMAR